MVRYNSWKLHVRKDNLKFSAAHMTVFPDGRKEGLHGHNYEIQIEIELNEPELPKMISYKTFKQALSLACNAWDEKVLVAGNNPWMEFLSDADGEYKFRLCGKRYTIPLDEVVVLHVDNITVENLSRVFFELFWEQLTLDRPVSCWEHLIAVSLTIEESRGQGATYSVRF